MSCAVAREGVVALRCGVFHGTLSEGGGRPQVLALLPRFNAIAQYEREIEAGHDPAALPHGDDADTARGMASLFAEVGEAHAMAISAGVTSTHWVSTSGG